MLAVIELKGDWLKRFARLPKEDWLVVLEKLKQAIPGAEFHFYEKAEPIDGVFRDLYTPGSQLVDLAETAPILAELQVEFEVKRFKGAYRAGISGASITNIQIAIPDQNLTQIKRVKVLEDQCTVELQKFLDRGWRILAICPPHAQRRPDYIMGHTDPDADDRRW